MRCGGARPSPGGRYSLVARCGARGRRRRRGAASLVGSSDAGHFSCARAHANSVVALSSKQCLKMFPIYLCYLSSYGVIGFYTIHRVGPSLTARPETLIHGREGRVNTGWPSPHLVQKVFICDTTINFRGGPLLAKLTSISRRPW